MNASLKPSYQNYKAGS